LLRWTFRRFELGRAVPRGRLHSWRRLLWVAGALLPPPVVPTRRVCHILVAHQLPRIAVVEAVAADDAGAAFIDHP
jgi:hypothetical protein